MFDSVEISVDLDVSGGSLDVSAGCVDGCVGSADVSSGCDEEYGSVADVDSEVTAGSVVNRPGVLLCLLVG